MTLRTLTLAAILAGAHAVALAQTAALRLDSPTDFQVFQRDTVSSGIMHVAGLATPGGTLRLRLEGGSPHGKLPRGWRKLPSPAPDGTFSADLRLPSGGFYALTLESRQPHAPRTTITIPHIGIGEVFVLAGQSNSTNYGEVPQKVTSGLVSTFDGHAWRIADDPQPGTQDHSKKGSFAPSFGDAMAARFRVPIGIASVGHGSTSVRQWLPAGSPVDVIPTMTRFITKASDGSLACDGALYNGLLERLRQLGPHGFRALLWHQGESDAHQAPAHDIPANTYARLMTLLIQSARRDAGWDFPWFVAQASYHNPTDTGSPELRAAQQSLWTSGLALQGPDTDALTGLNRQNSGQGVHFSAQGLQAHGHLWAEKVSVWLEPILAASKP